MLKNIKIILKKTLFFLWDDRFKFESNLEISRKLMMLNYVVIACILFLLPFGILSLLNGDYLVGSLDLIAGLLIFGAILYYKKTLNYIFLTYIIICVLGSLFLGLLFSAGVDYSGPLWSYLFPISAMFMLGKKKGTLFCFWVSFYCGCSIVHCFFF